MLFMKTTFRRSMLPFLSLHHDNRNLKYGCMNTLPKKNQILIKSQIQTCFYLSPRQFNLISVILYYVFIPQNTSISKRFSKYLSKHLALKSSIILMATFKETALNDPNNLNCGKLHLQRLLLTIMLL